jgi:hypothetical protein
MVIAAGVEMSEEDRTIKGPHLKMKGRLSRQEYAKLRVPNSRRMNQKRRSWLRFRVSLLCKRSE